MFKIPEGTYELNQINEEIKRQVPAINISANLATLKAIVKVDDDNILILFNVDYSIRTILGFNKKLYLMDTMKVIYLLTYYLSIQF